MNRFFTLLIAFLFLSCGIERTKSEEIKVHADSTLIRGQIDNYNRLDSILEINFYVNDLLDGQLEYKTKIDSLGKFEIKFPINRQQDIGVYYNQWINLIVSGGDEVELKLNAQDNTRQLAYKSLTIKGGSEKTNRQFLEYIVGDPLNGSSYFDKIQSLPASEFIKFHDSIFRIKNDYIIKFHKNNDVTDLLNNWIFVDKFYGRAEKVLGYKLYLQMFQKTAEISNIPDSFYDIIDSLPRLNEDHMINSDLSNSFAGYYSSYFSNEIRKSNQGIETKNLDSLIIRSIINQNKENSLLAQLVVNEKLKNAFENNDLAYYDNNKELFLELFAGTIFESRLNEKKIAIKQLLENPILPEKTSLLTFDTSDPDKYLDEIISKANGKVIYIDNWATWCAPCKSEFKTGTPELKQKFGDSVEYVYLCYQSKKELWKPAISEYKVEGKHYFIEKGEGTSLKKQFDLKGYPTYVIIDTKGEIVKSGFEFRPSIPETTKILSKLVAN